MAIQFPPVNPGDNAPADGDKFTYVPTQTEYIYDQTENSWSVVTGTGSPQPIVIGKITGGANITLDPPEGDLSLGDVEISAADPGTPPETFWKRTNGILSPKTESDDLQVLDSAGGAILVNELTNIDNI